MWYDVRVSRCDAMHRSLAPHSEEHVVSTCLTVCRCCVGGLPLRGIGGCAERTCARDWGLHTVCVV
jgi:hypothetical protein